ncbi:MAG: isocitrate/isopropylmalate family dehydrogenase, partial [Desulfobaccales bacterium]
MAKDRPTGEKITPAPGGGLQVPQHPIILFIVGDGTGPDIWQASRPVLDAAVAKAYGRQRQIVWQEVLAGEKAFKQTRSYLPVES